MSEALVETLWDRDGAKSAYQTRVKVGHFRIHIFWRGDRDPDMHDHPADFWTFPLVSYVEEVPYNDWGAVEHKVVRAFRPHFRRARYLHRVLGSFEGFERNFRTGRKPIVGNRPIVTLGWWFKKRREWGFRVNGCWVPWRTCVNTPGWSASPESRPPTPLEDPKPYPQSSLRTDEET